VNDIAVVRSLNVSGRSRTVMPVWFRRWRIVTFVGAGLVFASCSSGTEVGVSADQSTTVPPSTSTTESAVDPVDDGPTPVADNEASSERWQAEGDRLRAAKREDIPAGSYNASNAADFAYQSLPVDITEPGPYTVLIGPVDDWFTFPTNPSSVAMNTPGDEQFVVLFQQGRVVDHGGQRYLEAQLVVQERGEFAPYSGFTVWIY
jgi:hypothetical protein